MSCQGTHPQVRLRIAALRHLIGLLRVGEMRGADLCQAMHVSPSGLRNYIGMLARASIIELARREPTRFGDVGRPVYRLVASATRIEQFLAVEAPTLRNQSGPVPARPGRVIHLMIAAHSGQRVESRAVAADPLALPAAFFRQACPLQAAA